MYYWTLSDSLIPPLLFAILCLCWGIGGWLIIRRAFTLKPRETLVAGLAAGFILFITLINLFVRFLPLPVGVWASAIVLLAAGLGLNVGVKKRSAMPQSPSPAAGGPRWRKELAGWPQLVLLGIVVVVFVIVLRGLGILDDYYHLPLISVMAAGDIPPHFYLDSSLHMPYHYGLQVFAASLIRVGGFLPWNAWDVSRAIVLGLALVLGWHWARRMTGSTMGAYFGAILIFFGAGARWLMLFLPQSTLVRMGAGLQMDRTGAYAGNSLLGVLTGNFYMDGEGPLPFPLAYANGALEPLNFNLGASSVLWQVTILLLLLLAFQRRVSAASVVVLSLLLANLALSAENVYAVLFAGMALSLAWQVLYRRIRHKPFDKTLLVRWGIPLLISGVLVSIQSGFIGEAVVSKVAELAGKDYPLMTTDYQPFSIRWPPAVPNMHLGPLSLFNLGHIGILLAEAGPALLLLPVAVVFALKKSVRSNILLLGALVGSLGSFIFPILMRYGLDFNIARMISTALWLWLVLLFPLLWRRLARSQKAIYRLGGGVAYATTIFAGLVLLAFEFIAMPVPHPTYYITEGEIVFARKYWNRLEQDAQIFDCIPERSVTLFGRASFAATDVYKKSPIWAELLADPDPARLAAAGYHYVYMDRRRWWEFLSPQMQGAYGQPCVKEVAASTHSSYRLLDISACKP